MRVAKVDTTVPSLLNTWMVMIIDSVIFFLLALYLDHIFSSSTTGHAGAGMLGLGHVTVRIC